MTGRLEIPTNKFELEEKIMIKHLLFDVNCSSQYQKANSSGRPGLFNLSKVNVFVGPNNSGKSRIIRNILPVDFPIHDYLDQESINHTRNVVYERGYLSTVGMPKLRTRLEEFVDHDTGVSFTELFLNAYLFNGTFKLQPIIAEAILNLAELDQFFSNETFISNEHSIQIISDLFEQTLRRGEPPRIGVASTSAFKRMYIPLLRGLRPLIRSSDMIEAFGPNGTGQKVTMSIPELVGSVFGANETPAFDALNDLYRKATLRDYPDLKNRVKIYSGLSIYWDIKKLLLGNEQSRKKVLKFQDYLSDHFFEGQSVELVPQIDTPGTLHVNIGKKKDFAIHDLGDGIQAVIALLYPLFTQLDSSTLTIVGIEEPENNLHPGLQRQFLEALNHFKNVQFFITTHSNHFLHAIEEIGHASIYRVENHSHVFDEKEHNYTKTIGTSYGDFQTLESLGVLNTSVFLSNCTVWVEGPTDRRIFKHYLKLYLDRFKGDSKKILEDKHYSFVEYGGSNITHYSVLNEDPAPINVEHLCGKLMLIADHDNATGKKQQRHSHLAKTLGPRFVLLDCKEVENLCSPEVITKIVKNYLPEDSDFTFKSEWKTYKNVSLGGVIDKAIKKKGLTLTKGKKSFAYRDSIGEKVQFCNFTIENTQKWEDLTEEARRVVELIYNFIIESNFGDRCGS